MLKRILTKTAQAILLVVVILVAIPLLPVILLVALAAGLWRRFDEWRLRRRFAAVFGEEGKEMVFVYSNSPHWKERMEQVILPRVEKKAVVLNWSERSTEAWRRRPLAVRVFELWGGGREFNPMAVVFPTGRRTKTIRFWQAYRDFRHGKSKLLKDTEAELFDAIGLPDEERPEVPVIHVGW